MRVGWIWNGAAAIMIAKAGTDEIDAARMGCWGGCGRARRGF